MKYFDRILNVNEKIMYIRRFNQIEIVPNL